MATKLRKLINEWRTHKGVQRYFFSVSWMLVERVLRIISSIGVGIYVARFLGPDNFGIYSYALAFFMIASVVARLGLNPVLVREIVVSPEKRDMLFGTAFWMTVGGALFSLGMLAFITMMIGTDPTTRVYILIIGCGLIFQAFDVVEAFFTAKVMTRPVSIAKIMQLILSSVLKLILVWQQAGLIWFVLVSLIDQITLAGFMSAAYIRHANLGFMRLFDFSEASRMLSRAWMRIIIALSTIVFLRIDLIMLMEIKGSHSAGLYASAARITEAVLIPVLVLVGALMPALFSARERSKDLYDDRLQRLFFLMTWLSIGVALTIVFASGSIISLFGNDFREATELLVVHALVLIPFSQWLVLQRWSLAENLEVLIMYYLVAGAVLNVMLNLILIRQYGTVGAALATVISQVLITYAAPLFSRNSRPVVFMLYKSIYKWKA